MEFRVNHPPASLFDQFLSERRYLQNVTPATLVWYRVAFRNWHALIGPSHAPSLPTKATLQHFVVALRERGIKPVTVNTYLGAMNAFCRWLYDEGHARERVKIGKLRVERRLLTLLDDSQMRTLIGFKPRTFRQARTHLAVVLILDIGLRISEALNLRDGDIDFDNLVLKVFGKGQKERLVPFSPELRRRIYRYPVVDSESAAVNKGGGANPSPWDQASVLVQLGLIDPTALPVSGAESVDKVLDPRLPSRSI